MITCNNVCSMCFICQFPQENKTMYPLIYVHIINFQLQNSNVLKLGIATRFNDSAMQPINWCIHTHMPVSTGKQDYVTFNIYVHIINFQLQNSNVLKLGIATRFNDSAMQPINWCTAVRHKLY